MDYFPEMTSSLTWLILIQQYIPKAVATSSSNVLKHGPVFLLHNWATPSIVPENNKSQGHKNCHKSTHFIDKTYDRVHTGNMSKIQGLLKTFQSISNSFQGLKVNEKY